ADFTAPTTICTGEPSLALSSLLDPGSTPGGNWQLDGQTTTTLNPATLSPGNHQLSYTATLGDCTLTSMGSFAVQAAPEAGTTTALTLCADAPTPIDLSQQLSGADANGSWVNPPGNPGAVLINGQFTPGGPGEYQLLYIVPGQGNCDPDTASLVITVDPVPVASLPATAVIDCFDPTVNLESPAQGGNILYTWFVNGNPLLDNNLPSLLVSEAGSYRLEVLDQSTGCSASSTTEVSSQIADITFDVATEPATCQDPNAGSISILNASGGTGPYLVSLNEGPFSETSTLTGLEPGAYTIRVQDAAGCEATAATQLPTPAVPSITLSVQPTEIVMGEVVTVRLNNLNSPLSTITWDPAPVGCDSCLQWQDKPVLNTTYSVTVTDELGCTATATADLIVRTEVNIFFPNALSPNGDGANDHFTIYDGGVVELVEALRIFDRWGNLIFERQDMATNDPSQGWDGTLAGEAVNPGVYLYQAEIRLTNGELRQFTGSVTVIH
ncbi:MAG: gliding motility-associated C-terminal domain-containing protein, partial [Lewinella sp.]|nr:gliding motility-associated C-terminal domain-containing protein [Lewinella sp.]